MDVLIRGGTVVTMNPDREVAELDVLLRDDRILRIAPRGKLKNLQRPARIVDARGCAVIPGLVQCHLHLCQALFRGMANDLPLLPWLKTRIWPLEAAHDPASLRASAELGLLEMMLAGTTTILDMGTVHHQDAVFRAMDRSGIRGFSGKAMMDQGKGIPKGLRESTKASVGESVRLQKRWDGKGQGRLGYAFAPRFILSCSERLWRQVADAAADSDAIVHSHIAEHADERKAVKEILGKDDVAALTDFGISGPNVVLAHGVQLRKSEMKQMARAGTRVVHCPSANLKLASGIADVSAMRASGMVVGIGPDGAPCNNRMDPWTELRHAALLPKGAQRDATVMPAAAALELATIEGARVLGLDQEIGSIEVGKKADLAVVRLGTPHSEPGGGITERLVYSAVASDVQDVFVNGERTVRNGEHQRLDGERVLSNARQQATKVLKRARVTG